MKKSTPLRIILSGGGTGGHIFPAVAIANALKLLRPDTEFLFIGALGRMEMEKVPQAGYPIEGLWISGLKRELTFANLSFPFKLLSSVIKARRIVKHFKPDIVIGTGGYASGPTLRAAASLGIPIAIQEQNSFPGITNKLLAPRAAKIYTAYQGLEKFFPADKILLTGNPIRNESVSIAGKRAEAASFFGLDPHVTTLLIVGGSQGARSINHAVRNNLARLTAGKMQLVWQTGAAFEPEALEAVKAQQDKAIRVLPFISRMDLAYAMADLIVSRAGAIAIAELMVVGKPVILVPLPTAAEDHQRHNAESLVNKGAALMIADHHLDKELVDTVTNLADNAALRLSLGESIAALALPSADKTIANDILNLLNPTL